MEAWEATIRTWGRTELKVPDGQPTRKMETEDRSRNPKARSLSDTNGDPFLQQRFGRRHTVRLPNVRITTLVKLVDARCSSQASQLAAGVAGASQSARTALPFLLHAFRPDKARDKPLISDLRALTLLSAHARVDAKARPQFRPLELLCNASAAVSAAEAHAACCKRYPNLTVPSLNSSSALHLHCSALPHPASLSPEGLSPSCRTSSSSPASSRSS